MTTPSKVILTICWVLVVAALAGMTLAMEPAWLLLAFAASFIRFFSKRWVPPMSKRETWILLALALVAATLAIAKALAIERQGPHWAP